VARCACGWTRGCAEQHDAEEGRLQEERGQHLVAEQRPGDVADRSMKPGQLVPNWKLMVMPLTTPSAKDSAKTLTQEQHREVEHLDLGLDPCSSISPASQSISSGLFS
jgi:hypothetical protein